MGFLRSWGWLSFRGSADKVTELGQTLAPYLLVSQAWLGCSFICGLNLLLASIKSQSITGSGLSPGRALVPTGTVQGLVIVPADQLPRGVDRGQEEARCWGGSWVPQRRRHCGGGGGRPFPQGSWGASIYSVPWARGHWISQVPRVTEDDPEASVISALLRLTGVQTPDLPLGWLADPGQVT